MLILNNDKTEFFVAYSPHYKRLMPAVTLPIGNTVIKPTETAQPGYYLWHYNVHVHAGFYTVHLRNILRIRRYLDFDTCTNVVRSLILSRLDYGNILLMGANSTDIARLQRLQNWAAKLIFLKPKKDHVSPLLQQLHWLPVKERIRYKIALYVYKCLAGLAPEYLASSIRLYIPSGAKMQP